MENKCAECDFYINNKQKGLVCLNPDSENFNQNVDKDNGCDKYESYFYTVASGDEKGLFE